MNCPKCGSLLPAGAQFCNVCNEPLVGSGYAPYGQPYTNQPTQAYGAQPPAQGYPRAYDPNAGYPGQQPGQAPGYPQQSFQQSYAQYNNTNYQGNYGAYYGTPPKRREPNAFLTAQLQLPSMLRDSFRDPGSVLQAMMERRDFYTPPVVAGLVLLLSFLCGMLLASGLVRSFFAVFTNLTGMTLASDAASFTQGVNAVASQVGASIGGIMALCQLFAMLMPLAVLMVYLCSVCKVRFSLELLCGCLTVLSLPSLAAGLLSLLLSLVTPLPVVALALFAMVVSYVFFGNLLGRVTGKQESTLVLPKVLCICLSLLLTLVFWALVGGTLMNGVVLSILGSLRI